MIPTKEYVERKFDEFNRLCFDGKLSRLPVVMSRGRSALGKLSFMRRRNPDGSEVYSGFTLRISTRYDLDERLVEDTIIHEMIHYHILSHGLRDTSPHGPIFRNIMADINRRHGRNIEITHRRTESEMAADTERRLHILLVAKFNDRKVCVTAFSRSASVLLPIWDTLGRVVGLSDYRWVVSADAYFNRLPRSRSLKFYRLPLDELRRRLTAVNPIIRDGRTLTTGRAIDLTDFLADAR
ncbi:MAG: SprT-like domain-containing protein [Muribaculaceae bacterium]|nr:SprT-like domain-containing protein [Muribaculaceae bacterium]